MNDSFATAMGRALDLTRGGSPLEATRAIQDALKGKGPTADMKAAPATPRVRQRLGRVIDALTSGKRRSGARATTPPVPDGARYESRTHGSPYGGRDYRLFVPSARDEVPVGLVLMLHGCTQTADDFAVGTRMNLVAEEANLIVVYPDQTRQANQMGCWNWFRPEDQRRDSGEPGILAHLARAVAAEFGVEDTRVFVAGLSAGGAMAAILGQAYPDVFSAVGVHSGLAPGAASDVNGAFAAMQGGGRAPVRSDAAPMRTIVFHGSADTTVAPVNADAVLASALGRARAAEVEDRSVTGATVTVFQGADGTPLAEKWSLGGVAHAWSGGAAEGSHTDPTGPDASREMVRFFLAGARAVTA